MDGRVLNKEWNKHWASGWKNKAPICKTNINPLSLSGRQQESPFSTENYLFPNANLYLLVQKATRCVAGNFTTLY